MNVRGYRWWILLTLVFHPLCTLFEYSSPHNSYFKSALVRSALAETIAHAQLSGRELEVLVEPIALYPDVILGCLLPASTFPDQIVDAALLIKSKSDAALIKDQTWDQSVKVVSSYPGVLKMMFEKITWTTNLGNAVIAQHREVLDAIQRMRGKAMAQGNLVSNEQQVVASQAAPNGNTIITVAPADPEVVYVPTSTSTTVYEQPSNTSSALVPLATFGLGMALGAALDDDDDDHYYYGGGWGGPSYWYNDNVDHWLDNRREVWEDYNDRKWDQQEFRQDMISEGKWPRTPEQRTQSRQQAEARAQTWKQNNPDKAQQLASARSNRQSLSDTGLSNRTGSGGNFSKSKSIPQTTSQRPASSSTWSNSRTNVSQGSRDLFPKSSSNNPFQGYGSRKPTTTYSSRGSYSRSTAGFSGASRGGYSGRSGGFSGGGGSRGGGGRGGRR